MLLIVGENDKAVPPSSAGTVAAEVPGAVLAAIPGAGHLAHEERPDRVCELIFEQATRVGILRDR